MRLILLLGSPLKSTSPERPRIYREILQAADLMDPEE